jgi:subfamily B ATP-binding cassette protein MsbA
LASPLSQFLGVTVFCALLFYGGKLVLEEKYMPPENFLVFVLLFANVIAPLKSLFSVIANMQRGLVAGTRIFKVLDEKSLIQDKSDAIDFKKFQNEIELQDLVFRYEEQNVLDHFSFKVKKGMSVALVGPSGAGKSTIINLVPRFYDVIGGAIKIDGVDIRDIKLHHLDRNRLRRQQIHLQYPRFNPF